MLDDLSLVDLSEPLTFTLARRSPDRINFAPHGHWNLTFTQASPSACGQP